MVEIPANPVGATLLLTPSNVDLQYYLHSWTITGNYTLLKTKCTFKVVHPDHSVMHKFFYSYAGDEGH